MACCYIVVHNQIDGLSDVNAGTFIRRIITLIIICQQVTHLPSLKRDKLVKCPISVGITPVNLFMAMNDRMKCCCTQLEGLIFDEFSRLCNKISWSMFCRMHVMNCTLT